MKLQVCQWIQVKLQITQRYIKKLLSVMTNLLQFPKMIPYGMIKVKHYTFIHQKSYTVVQNLQKYQEAIDCYEICIAINPQNDAVWRNKGQMILILSSLCINIQLQIILLKQLKKHSEAILCYDQALSICIDPQTLQLKGRQFLIRFN
ncbi:unnamed protein product [Paramecium octaurelia]|uniref:Tetratricopeptide repeat protein n=1 Tax=Paramecium octaurelia TaxID=43137 RepID=A0A8S1TF87_PAROT|nr:unnamed protein product [Paramecium octaurelia]